METPSRIGSRSSAEGHCNAPARFRTDPRFARQEFLSAVIQMAPPDRYEQPKGFGVMLAIKDPAEAQRAFAALVVRQK